MMAGLGPYPVMKDSPSSPSFPSSAWERDPPSSACRAPSHRKQSFPCRVSKQSLGARGEGDAQGRPLLHLGQAGIHVAEYLTDLPPREVLRQKLHEAIALSRRRLESLGGER